MGRDRRPAGETARLWTRGRTLLHLRTAAQRHAHRRPHDGFLSHLPAIARLFPRMVAIAILAVAYVAMTMAIAAGLFTALDHQVGQATHDIWNESLHLAFRGLAELGGLEMTTLLMAGLFLYLWRGGFGTDSLVVIAF